MKKAKKSRFAAIRTVIDLAHWSLAKRKKHDVSMIETPSAWIYKKVNGVFYPYEVI